MRVLLDELVPKKFVDEFKEIYASHVLIEGWSGLKNGRLLDAAEQADFQVLLTCDKQLRFQQNFSGRVISIVVIDIHPTNLETLRTITADIMRTLRSVSPGQIVVINGPHPKRNK